MPQVEPRWGKPKQQDKRTATERRAYMARYHEGRKQMRQTARARVDTFGVIRGLAVRYSYMGDGELRRHELRDGSGRMMWPERSRIEPESWSTTLARVK
jgi:hypothetical protein